jgi:glutamate-1-semialdehyde 2,1-aminomutase
VAAATAVPRSTDRYLGGDSASKSLYERALNVMPGGNSRHTLVMDPYPIYAASGQGCIVTDVEGQERIDFVNNYTSLILGHSHPGVTEAVARVIGNGTAFSLPTETDIRLAELLVERIPYIDQVRFANSGSEGVLLAIRAARAATGRSKIAKFEGCYHGIYDYAQASDSSRPKNWGESERPATTLEPSMAKSLETEVVTLPLNDIEVCGALIDEHRDDLAAVLLDPLPAALGLIPPEPAFVAAIRAKTRECGALLIADEVLSFRIDYRGACHRFGIEPDLVSLGKIIGGGFPVGAVAGKADVMSVFDHRDGELVHHGGTYNGNPVTMVAGYETMKRLTPDVFTEFDRLGDRVRTGLQEVLRRHGIEAVATGRGSLFAVVPGNEPPKDFRAVFSARSAAPQIQKIALEIAQPGHADGRPRPVRRALDTDGRRGDRPLSGGRRQRRPLGAPAPSPAAAEGGQELATAEGRRPPLRSEVCGLARLPQRPAGAPAHPVEFNVVPGGGRAARPGPGCGSQVRSG